MSNILLIDSSSRARIKRVKDFAQENKYSSDQIKSMIDGECHAPGDIDEHVIYLFKNYRCVFSIECHPAGMCRHLSISVKETGKYPSVPAVEMIMREFDFFGNLDFFLGKVWLDHETESVNVVQPIELNPDINTTVH